MCETAENGQKYRNETNASGALAGVAEGDLYTSSSGLVGLMHMPQEVTANKRCHVKEPAHQRLDWAT